MTARQREALRAMADRQIGALLTRRGWTWREHVRASGPEGRDAAEAILERLGALDAR